MFLINRLASDSTQRSFMLCSRIHANDLHCRALSSAMPDVIISCHEPESVSMVAVKL